MLLPDFLSAPAQVSVVTDEHGTVSLPPSDSPSVWAGSGVTVWTEPAIVEATGRQGTAVMLHAPNVGVRRIHLRWSLPIPDGLRFLGDHWERGYGDLEWRGLVPERKMPWYFLAHDENADTTHGVGVQTGAAAGGLCVWQVDGASVHLWIDVCSGSRGVQLGNRTLTAAVILTRHGESGESPFAAAQAFCQTLCPKPRLPSHPVYGGNNWYYAYGRSSHDEFLRDTDLIASLAPEGTDNRPYSVIDDGWQANRLAPLSSVQQGGPWNRGNDRFPDMPRLAKAIRDRGARPGIWIRPLGAAPGTPESRLLPPLRANGNDNMGVAALDPSIAENLAQVAADIRGLRDWGYELIKHDWTTCDILGRWGFGMWGFGRDEAFTSGDWTFADRSRTTAEIIHALYAALREGAGEGPDGALLIGCNTVGHLGAGLFEIQRTGDDTSGQEWDRTRKMGVNTLAFRMCQQGTFFASDADCVGLTNAVPWHLNRQWLDLLAHSGTPLFVSAAPDAVGPPQRDALKAAFAFAAQTPPRAVAEPLDWRENGLSTPLAVVRRRNRGLRLV